MAAQVTEIISLRLHLPVSPYISLYLPTSPYISRQVAEIMALRLGDFFSEKTPQRAGMLAPAPARTLAPPQPLALPRTL